MWAFNVAVAVLAAESTLLSTAQKLPARDPRIHFLFLAADGINNWPVWQAFFQGGKQEQYRALAHCSGTCKPTEGLTVIPSTRSWWCSDLVSPMVHLLTEAVKDSSEKDKFAFVSYQALPVKPFPEVYRTLLQRESSDFCTFEPNTWRFMQSGGKLQVHVKAHQWSVLNAQHAQTAVKVYWSKDWNSRHLAKNLGGCLDEWWFMAAIFGPREPGPDGRALNFTGLSGSPLTIAKDIVQFQG